MKIGLRLLAAREHSRAELRRKLGARESDPGSVEQVLDDLESRGYLSDSRFAEQYVTERKRKGYGPLRISQELKQKGIAEDLIAQQADPSDPEWWELLKHVAQRKFGAKPPADRKTQAKWARYLEYRGFAVEQIRDLLWKHD